MEPNNHPAELHERVGRLVRAATGAHNAPLRQSSRDQLRRWGPAILEACDRLGLDLRDADTAVEPILDAAELPIERAPGGWAIRRLAAAAREVGPRRTAARGFASITDGVPEGSRVGRAIARRLAAAPSEAQRRVRRSHIGRFLAWCEVTGRSPEATFAGELFAYRRACLAAGLVPDGPVCEARALLDGIRDPAATLPSRERVTWSRNARLSPAGVTP